MCRCLEMMSILVEVTAQKAELSGVPETSRESRGQGRELQTSRGRTRRLFVTSLPQHI